MLPCMLSESYLSHGLAALPPTWAGKHFAEVAGMHALLEDLVGVHSVLRLQLGAQLLPPCPQGDGLALVSPTSILAAAVAVAAPACQACSALCSVARSLAGREVAKA